MNIILLSLLVGIAGMGFGGLITAVLGGKTDKMVSIFLALAGGVMTSIVLLELIPEAMEYSNVWITTIGVVAGVLMVLVLHSVIDKISSKSKPQAKMHETYAEYFHANDIIKAKDYGTGKNKMIRSGVIMMVAIALHNIPEGLAMGAAGQHDMELGITIAIMIALHNIPEGMAVAAPFISGGVSKPKTVMLTFLTGATTVVGAVIGVLIAGISYTTLALSFAIAGGAMLYVVFGEILPQSIVTNKDRVPAVFALVGVIAGMLITQI